MNPSKTELMLPYYLFVCSNLFFPVFGGLSTNISESDPWPPLISQRLAQREKGETRGGGRKRGKEGKEMSL